MKIYFDGCSHTWGSELTDLNSRYSKIISNNYDAEEYNIAERGGSDKRMVRNLLEHDLTQYDMFVIQMTGKNRTEYYHDGKWKKVNWNTIFYKVDYKGNESVPKEIKQTWYDYYTLIHTEELADSNQLLYYTVIKGLIEHKPHVIIGIDNSDKLPLNFSYNKNLPRAKGGHPSELGHNKIASDIINENLL